MKPTLVDNMYGTGAVYQQPDEKTYTYFGLGAKPVDWELGRSIRKILAFRASVSKQDFDRYNLADDDDYKKILTFLRKKNIKDFKPQIFNQNGSESCVAQSVCWYQTVKNFIETGLWEPLSAKDLYPFIRLSGGGAAVFSGFEHKNTQGIALESIVPSYVNGLPPKEEYMRVKPVLTNMQKLSRHVAKGTDYRQIVQHNSIDKVAEAIRDNLLAVSGVKGENNGTWFSEYPQPPAGAPGWRHAIVLPEYGLNSRKEKIIEFPNSWGENTGLKGWQKLTESYFKNNCVFNVHVDTDAENYLEAKRPFEKAKEWLEKNLGSVKKKYPNVYIGSFYHSLVWQEMQKALGLKDYRQTDFYNYAQFIKLQMKV